MVRKIKYNSRSDLKDGSGIFLPDGVVYWREKEDLAELKRYHKKQKKKNLEKMRARFAEGKDLWEE